MKGDCSFEADTQNLGAKPRTSLPVSIWKEIADWDVQGFCEICDDLDSGVSFATLDASDVGPVAS